VEKARLLIGAYYDAFNRGDWEAMGSLVSDDLAHDVNEGGRREGRRAFLDFLSHMGRCYREQVSDLCILVSADGRRAAAEFSVSGAYLETDGALPPARGQSYTLPAGAFFDLQDGRIRRVTTYYNLREWMRQIS